MGDWIKAIFVASLGFVFILLAPFILAIFFGALAFGGTVLLIWFFLKVLKEEREELKKDKDSH